MPPLPDEDNVPSQSPSQDSSVPLAVTVSTGGAVTVVWSVTSQPAPSVAVTVKVPAHTPVWFCPAPKPPSQEYEIPPVPPVVVADTVPVQGVPAHRLGVDEAVTVNTGAAATVMSMIFSQLFASVTVTV